MDSNGFIKHFPVDYVLHDLDNKRIQIKSFVVNTCYGLIYSVEYEGNEKRLIWYDSVKRETEYEKLINDVKCGSPSPLIAWPEAVTEKIDSSFGYIFPVFDMTVYSDINSFIENVSSLSALLIACRSVALAFQFLHEKGLCFKNIDIGDFLFEKETGNIRICNYENYAICGTETDYYISRNIAAPEIVEGDRRVDINTDAFSLAIILFRLLMGNHPFEGERVITFMPGIATEDINKFIYGKRAVFVFDRDDSSNTPVEGIQDSLIYRWGKMPAVIQEMFILSFSKTYIENPGARTKTDLWISLFDDFIKGGGKR